MKIKGHDNHHTAFTFLEILIVVVTVVFLAALILPLFARAKTRSNFGCISRLKQVGLGFRMWSNDNGEKFPWQVSTNRGGTLEYAASSEVWRHYAIASNEFNSPKILRCPYDQSRIAASGWASFKNINLSYFAGLEADETRPNTILSGDRNLTTNGVALKPGVALVATNHALGYTTAIHNGSGNIGLGDGSAQMIAPAALNTQFQLAARTNALPALRFALP